MIACSMWWMQPRPASLLASSLFRFCRSQVWAKNTCAPYVNRLHCLACYSTKAMHRLTNVFFSRRLSEQIWNLSNCRGQPTLTRAEFYIAMRFVALAQMSFPLSFHTFITHVNTMPFPTFPTFTGVPNPRPLRKQGAPATAAAPAGVWVVRKELVPKFRQRFTTVDADADGYITAAEAAELFGASKLPPPVRRR